MIQGINAGQSSLINACINVANLSYKATKTSLGIHSPSRVFKDLFEYVPLGAAEGIKAATPELLDAMTTMSDQLVASTELPEFNMDYSQAQKTIENLGTGLQVKRNDTTSVTLEFSDDTINRLGNRVQRGVEDGMDGVNIESNVYLDETKVSKAQRKSNRTSGRSSSTVLT